MAKQVTRFMDDDGGIHKTMKEAQQADKELLMKKQLYDIAQSIHTYNMTVDELAASLFEYRSSLKGILF